MALAQLGKRPPTPEKVAALARPLKHKQGRKYERRPSHTPLTDEDRRRIKEYRRRRKQQAAAGGEEEGESERVERSLESGSVEGMELTQLVTKTVEG